MQRLLERRGLESGGADLCQADPVVEESPALAGISSASIQGRIALGSRAGARVWRVGDDPDAPWVLSTAPRHAHLAGFDLHANVTVPAADRPRLEQFCRYLLRPSLTLTLNSQGIAVSLILAERAMRSVTTPAVPQSSNPSQPNRST